MRLIALILASNCFGFEVTQGFLDKIAMIESEQRCTAVGDRGASLGRYQIQRSVWTDCCARNGVDWKYNRDNAFNYPLANQVAKWHLEWIVDNLQKRGIKPNEMVVYMAYNKGLNGARRLGYNTQLDDPALNRARAFLCPCR